MNSSTMQGGEQAAADMGIALVGTRAELLSERALWLPDHSALLVADLHWGKAAAFRAANVPVPTGTTAADLSRLSQALHRTNAHHLVFLGDLLHAKHGRHVDTLNTISTWRAKHADVAMTLVRGNHDRHAGDPPAELNIDCKHVMAIGPFVCLHEPAKSADGYVLSGHLHPHVTLGGRGRQRVRLPCFVFGEGVGVLPAFSSFTGCGMYERDPDDAIFAVVHDEIVAVATNATATPR